jgi:hypothetical protein
VITAREHWSLATLQKLKPILGRFVT